MEKEKQHVALFCTDSSVSMEELDSSTQWKRYSDFNVLLEAVLQRIVIGIIQLSDSPRSIVYELQKMLALQKSVSYAQKFVFPVETRAVRQNMLLKDIIRMMLNGKWDLNRAVCLPLSCQLPCILSLMTHTYASFDVLIIDTKLHIMQGMTYIFEPWDYLSVRQVLYVPNDEYFLKRTGKNAKLILIESSIFENQELMKALQERHPKATFVPTYSDKPAKENGPAIIFKDYLLMQSASVEGVRRFVQTISKIIEETTLTA